VSEDNVTSAIVEIFHVSRQNYETGKIKVELKKCGFIVSRRKIRSDYKRTRPCLYLHRGSFKSTCEGIHESDQTNELNQEDELTAVVSDLTYVRVNQKWHYVCLFVDLFNQEIISYSAGLIRIPS